MTCNKRRIPEKVLGDKKPEFDAYLGKLKLETRSNGVGNHISHAFSSLNIM